MSNKHILRSYRMTHITGFAPNVNGGVLTLATCLGGLRRHWKCGEWIGGFVGKEAAKELQNSNVEKNLVYLAKVSKTLDLESYWNDYPQKRLDRDEWGDNIYEPNGKGDYIIHWKNETQKDKEWNKKNIQTNLVLVCEEFYYFGKDNTLKLPMIDGIFVPIRGVAKTIDLATIDKLINFVRDNKDKCQAYKDKNGTSGGSGLEFGTSSCGGCDTKNNTKKMPNKQKCK